MGLFRSKQNTDTPRRRRSSEPVRQPKLMQGQDEYTFRRSRTITGSVSSEVKVASEQKAQLKSPRLQEHELRARRRKLLSGLAIILCLAASIYWLLTQFTARVVIHGYTPKPIKAINSPEYAEAIQQYLRERPFERLAFALNQEQLSGYVQKKHPEVATIQLDNDAAIGSSGFTIGLRVPVVSWRVAPKQYYVDGNGVSFERNMFNEPSVKIKDDTGLTLGASGAAIASQRFLGFVGRVVILVNDSGIGTVSEVVMPAGTTRTVSIGLKGKGYTLKLHIDRDPAAQVEDARLAIAYMKPRNITPKYIDVRVAGKAFYR
ncbi:MAG TPA: hypothetical protein VD907_04510 [Verrucomicrobiae bacterium]|nr:hypothetical protein [Verrucomicrobiae bacterium]